MDYIGPKEDDRKLLQFSRHEGHANIVSLADHHHAEVYEPKTMADYVKPEYWYK